MPVFDGADFVRETLDCIRAQTFRDYRVLISVDGGDERCAALCVPYCADHRFELVLQPQLLGWTGNMNWLIERARGQYFCYWQQDDLADKSYLQALFAWAERHPIVSCAYADVQWFGTRSVRCEQESIRGSVRQRMQRAFRTYHWSSLRGLVRRQALSRISPLPDTVFNVDFTWAVKLAREGELHRVTGPLYYKRAHPESASARGASLVVDPSRWHDLLAFAHQLLDLKLPRRPTARGRWRAIGNIVARLLLPAPESVPLFPVTGFTPGVRRRLLLDLIDRVDRRDPPAAGEVPHASLFAKAANVVDRDLHAVRQWMVARQRVFDASEKAGPVTLGLGAAEGNEWLLREGWSETEAWGVWSTGDACRISIPIPTLMKAAQIALRLRAYVPAAGQGRQVFVQVGDTEPALTRFDTGAMQEFCTNVPRPLLETSGSVSICFRTPGSVSPSDVGGGADPRKLGIGLQRVQVGLAA